MSGIGSGCSGVIRGLCRRRIQELDSPMVVGLRDGDRRTVIRSPPMVVRDNGVLLGLRVARNFPPPVGRIVGRSMLRTFYRSRIWITLDFRFGGYRIIFQEIKLTPPQRKQERKIETKRPSVRSRNKKVKQQINNPPAVLSQGHFHDIQHSPRRYVHQRRPN